MEEVLIAARTKARARYSSYVVACCMTPRTGLTDAELLN